MRVFLPLVMSLMSLISLAQRNNTHWCFGQNSGLLFQGNTSGAAPANIFGPIKFYPVINTSGGSATVSHTSTGNLLFYFNKGDLYDRNYKPMPNGKGISADTTGNTTQGACIVPVVHDPRKFYVFTLGGANGLLAYSVVDTTLRSGLGDVVAGQKFINIDSGFSEAMTVTEGCKGYWLIVYNKLNSNFYAYKIASSGINFSPVVSVATYPKPPGSSMSIKLSPDRRLLGLAAINGSFVAMHNFDARTGRITNARLIDTSMSSAAGFYGCDFSSDSRRFYATAPNRKDIYQYDLTQATTNAIIASKNIVHHDTLAPGGMQLGPDGNVYVALINTQRVDRITNANDLFPGCAYSQVSPYNPTSTVLWGLPQRVPRAIFQRADSAFVSIKDKTDCLNPSTVIYGPEGMAWYKWQDGSMNDSFVTNTSGVYWVTAYDGCATFIDSISVGGFSSYENHTVNDSICPGKSLILFHYRDLDQSGANWLWNTGSINDSLTVSAAGKYWVVMKNKTCHLSIDTFNIKSIFTDYTLAPDTIICPGDTINLLAGSFPQNTKIVWSGGDTGVVTKVYNRGNYFFDAMYDGCKISDTIGVTEYATPRIELGDDREICYGELLLLPVNDTSANGDKFIWQDGSTERSFTVAETGTYYVEVVGRCQTVRDTVEITVNPCNIFFPSAFSPNGDGENDIARLIGDIANVKNFEIHIFNRWGQEVFVSTDVYFGWDGTFKSKPAEMGAYYYYMKFKYRDKNEMIKSDITLIK
ncbi:MAG: gliding motility-associated C-terminal domain-containing protein [Bacteroidetes bacterium]|nr:gliding motility-associated C-terminal domain-containing protein [Bacteroidota bacterium]